ncbi:alpha-amylase domain-containing protein [Xenorhabdus stockiae]
MIHELSLCQHGTWTGRTVKERTGNAGGTILQDCSGWGSF